LGGLPLELEHRHRVEDHVGACNVDGKAMRTIIALAYVFLSNVSLADTVRHPGVPERVWGTWAPSVDLCRDDQSTVTVSRKSYVTGQENCDVQWVVETAGRSGPIYSARMRCSSPAAPKRTTELNRIIMPNESGQLSVGPDVKELKTYHRCPSE
jgi:hypothetical protein